MNTDAQTIQTLDDLSSFIEADLRRLESLHADMITPAALAAATKTIAKSR